MPLSFPPERLPGQNGDDAVAALPAAIWAATKRRPLWVAGLLVALCVAAALSPLRHVLRGWLAGESFHHGLPSSYWSAALADPNPDVRHRATSAVTQGGEGAAGAIPALV